MILFLPEGILLATALAVLVFDFITLKPDRLALFWFSLVGLLFSFGAAIYLGLFFKALFGLAGMLVILINYEFFASQVKLHEGEFYFLLLCSIIGLMAAVSSTNLLTIYLGIEMVSYTGYLLAGWQKEVPRSGEASLKYFLFGAVASAIFLYGISLLYGLTGTFDLSALPLLNAADPLTFLSLLFLILGLGFKIALAPMHFWCPDVYEGAPTPVTAYLSVGPKAMGLGILLNLLILLKLDLAMLIALISLVTMTWGNLSALRQQNIKRLLAYSSIAQAGYIMIALVSPVLGYGVIGFYLLVYALANLGAFGAVIYLSLLTGKEDVDSFAGFSQRSPFLAASFVIFFLSLIGIPPLAGFAAKFLVFKAAVGSGFLWLAAAGVVNSVVSVYYYLSIVQVMYFRSGDDSSVHLPAWLVATLLICLTGTILLGLFPNLIL